MHARVAASVVVVAIALGVGPAQAETRLTLCNNSKDTLRVAILYQNNPLFPLAESWKVYGWGDFPPGCQGVVQHVALIEIFLSITRKHPKGNRVMHFPFNTKAQIDAVRTGTLAAERFFCVTDEPFDRILKVPDEHERCPPGWYQQLFNLYVRVEPNKRFTIDLGRTR